MTEEFSPFKFMLNSNHLQNFATITDYEVSQLKQNIINILNTIKSNPDPMFNECYDYVSSAQSFVDNPLSHENCRMTVHLSNGLIYLRRDSDTIYQFKIYFKSVQDISKSVHVYKIEEIVTSDKNIYQPNNIEEYKHDNSYEIVYDVKGDIINENYQWCYKINEHNKEKSEIANMILISHDRRYYRCVQKSSHNLENKIIHYLNYGKFNDNDPAEHIYISKCTYSPEYIIEGNYMPASYTTIYLYDRYDMRMGFLRPRRFEYQIMPQLKEITSKSKFPIDQYENAPLDDVIEMYNSLHMTRDHKYENKDHDEEDEGEDEEEDEEMNTYNYEKYSDIYFQYIVEQLAKLNDDRLYQYLNSDRDRFQYCGGGENVISVYLSSDFDNVKHDIRFIDFILNATYYHSESIIDEILYESPENSAYMKTINNIKDNEESDESENENDENNTEPNTLFVNSQSPESPFMLINTECSKNAMFAGFSSYPELNGIKCVVTNDNYMNMYILLCMIIFGVRENELKINFQIRSGYF